MHAIKISVYQLRHSIRSKEQRTYQKLKRPLLQTIAGCTNVGGTRCEKMKLTRRNASPRHRNILKTIRRDDCKVLIKQVLLTRLGKAKSNSNEKNCGVPLHCSAAPPLRDGTAMSSPTEITMHTCFTIILQWGRSS